jgi:hypothetical protein
MNSNSNRSVKTLVAAAVMVLIAALLGLTALAQEHPSHHSAAAGDTLAVGRKGEVHFTVPVKAGEVTLKPGMYQVQHVEEGGNHVFVFRQMTMPAGYKMSNTPVGNEVARIQCKVEPTSKKVRNTRVILRTNSAGEKEIAEVQVAGEAFRHLF